MRAGVKKLKTPDYASNWGQPVLESYDLFSCLGFRCGDCTENVHNLCKNRKGKWVEQQESRDTPPPPEKISIDQIFQRRFGTLKVEFSGFPGCGLCGRPWRLAARKWKMKIVASAGHRPSDCATVWFLLQRERHLPSHHDALCRDLALLPGWILSVCLGSSTATFAPQHSSPEMDLRPLNSFMYCILLEK